MESLSISDFINYDLYDLDDIKLLLGPHLNWNRIALASINFFFGPNHWLWLLIIGPMPFINVLIMDRLMLTLAMVEMHYGRFRYFMEESPIMIIFMLVI